MVLEALNGIDLALAEAEDARSRSAKEGTANHPGNNHIFVNAVAPDPEADPVHVEGHMRELMDRFQARHVVFGGLHGTSELNDIAKIKSFVSCGRL